MRQNDQMKSTSNKTIHEMIDAASPSTNFILGFVSEKRIMLPLPEQILVPGIFTIGSVSIFSPEMQRENDIVHVT